MMRSTRQVSAHRLIRRFAGVPAVWVFLASLVVWLVIKAVVGVRVSEQEEYEGVDLHECGLEAYPEFTKSGD
jgi:ammonia channel protein AmtB